MEGKITVELDYYYEPLEDKVYLSHPSLDGNLSLAASNEDLAQIQLNAINVSRPKTPIEEIVENSEELAEAIQELNRLVPEVIEAAKEKLKRRGK